jgi:hypothetical protein
VCFQCHAYNLLPLARGAGESIKPGVKRSGTPGSTVPSISSPWNGRRISDKIQEPLHSTRTLLTEGRCRPLRGLCFLIVIIPGVSLRVTPGFMLPSALRAEESAFVLIMSSKSYVTQSHYGRRQRLPLLSINSSASFGPHVPAS